MKRILSIALCMFISLNLIHAQERKKEKSKARLSRVNQENAYSIRLPEGLVHFENDPTQVVIKFRDGVSEEQKMRFFKENRYFGEYKKSWEVLVTKVVKAKLNVDPASYTEVIKQIAADDKVEYAAPVLKYNDQEHALYSRFFVKVKNNQDLSVLQEKARSLSFEIEKEFTRNIFFCKVNKHSAGNSFEIAQKLQALGLFEYAEPDFIFPYKKNSSDPSYNLQWALKNTGQYGGTPGADMNIDSAWTITMGSPGIRVAVMDEYGSLADLVHPDLSFDTAYDATGIGWNYPVYPLEHGFACASIIGETANNGLGGTGVAPNVKIAAVRMAVAPYDSSIGFYVYLVDYSTIANAIYWASQNADIISNSWTYGASSSFINSLISDALVYGRGGKGTLFFSSAGNSDINYVSYPASNPNVISVAATSMCDERKSAVSCDGEYWWGSQYGPGLDVAAPGTHIFTADIAGAAGYDPTDYFDFFNGTSAACPMAASVMALILSHDTSLTAPVARYFLESTCSKVGGYTYNANVAGQPSGTWTEELGYGRVNAYAALSAITSCAGMPSAAVVSGPSLICPGISFSITGVTGSIAAGTTFEWQDSTANGSWTTIPGAISNILAVTDGINTATSYRLITTCANSSQQSISNEFFVEINNNPFLCCIPVVLFEDELIDNVTVAGINNTSTGFGVNGYQDFTNITGTAIMGNSYAFSADLSPLYQGDEISVWIDFDHDSVFSHPAELVLFDNSSYGAPVFYVPTGQITGTISIPYNALPGNTLMRVKVSYAEGDPLPCGQSDYGQTEDYTINILCPTASISGATAICPGGSTTLTASSGANYLWSTGATTPSINATQPGSYYVIVTQTNGCTDTSAVTTVTVMTVPNVIKIKMIGAAKVCEPNAVPLVLDMPASATAGFAHQWKLDGNPIPGATNNFYNADASGAYTLTVSGGSACTKTSAAKNVVIKPLPTATFTAGGPTTFCEGGSVTLTAPAITGYTYTWRKDGVNAGGGVSKTFKAGGEYTVIAKLSGCADTADTPVTVTVNPLPVASVSTADPVTICAGDSTTLMALPTGTGYFYDWKLGAAITATTTDGMYEAKATGSYKVIVTDDNGCVSKVSSTSVKIKVNPVPVVTITAVGSTTIASNGSVKLKASPSSGVTWQWYHNSDPIPGANGKEYIATVGGSYTVEAAKNGCPGISAVTTVTQNAVKEENAITSVSMEEAISFAIAVYPNPVSGTLVINVRGIEEVNATIYVMDMNGKLVAVKEMKEPTITVDMSGFAGGFYLIRYKDETRTGTIKVMKE